MRKNVAKYIRSVPAKKETYELTIPVTDPLTGRRKKITHRFIGTLAEAKKKLRTMQHVADEDATAVLSTKLTVRTAVEAYVKDQEQHVSRETMRSYRAKAKRLIDVFGDYRITDLKPHTITTLLSQLLEEGRQRQRINYSDEKTLHGLSRSTINTYHVFLRQVINQCIRWDWLSHNQNPFAKGGVKYYRVPRSTESMTYTWAEIGTLLAHAKERQTSEGYVVGQMFGMLSVALFAGLRRAEVVGLSWHKIDFEAGTMRVDQVIEDSKVRHRVKTVSSERKLVMPKFLLDVLSKIKSEQNKLRLAQPQFDSARFNLVFTDYRGNPIRCDAVTHAHRRILKGIELRKLTFHDLRATHATLCGALGVNDSVISRRLGHSDKSVTMRYYQERSNEQDARLADLFHQAFIQYAYPVHKAA